MDYEVAPGFFIALFLASFDALCARIAQKDYFLVLLACLCGFTNSICEAPIIVAALTPNLKDLQLEPPSKLTLEAYSRRLRYSDTPHQVLLHLNH